jgi:hypothetical protein
VCVIVQTVGVKTRTLLILSALTALAIVAASAVFLFQVVNR